MKKIHLVYLSILSGLFLYASWPVSPFTFFIFFGFVPLLWVETQVKKRSQFFWLTYLALLVWNICTTWWVLNSTLVGGILAVVLNPLLMCIPWMGFFNMKKRFGARVGYLSLIVFWLSFEYIHLTWELSWPWLTLGNVFATHPGWVQWYEYTGASGGSFWILLINISLFQWLQKSRLLAKITQQAQSALSTASFGFHQLLWILLDIILPLVVSFVIIGGIQPAVPRAGLPPNIVVVQPNVDPWDEKFIAGKEEAQLRKLIQLSESQMDANTTLVVWPETALPVAVNEDSIRQNYFMQPVWDFLKKHPNINLLTGIEGFRVFDEDHKTSDAQKIPNTNKYYEEYNTALLMDSSHSQAYHKSKLVPGAETLPGFLKFMGPWFEEFGGTAGGYVKQADRTVLQTSNHGYTIAPAVCYESIYGEFMSRYIRKGANLIVIITNDGWWRNTSGYKQHEVYARLRAIESRTWIARSANTGISCFINPSGEVFQAQPYNTVASIKQDIPMREPEITFYVKYGDIISKVAMTIAILLVFWDIIAIIKRKRDTRGENSSV